MTLGGALLSFPTSSSLKLSLLEPPGSAEEGSGTVTRGYRTAAPSKSREMNPPEFPIFSPF